MAQSTETIARPTSLTACHPTPTATWTAMSRCTASGPFCPIASDFS